MGGEKKIKIVCTKLQQPVEPVTLWGVLFTPKDGKLVAELPASEAKAMIEAGRAVKA